jgi:hypothetical protein
MTSKKFKNNIKKSQNLKVFYCVVYILLDWEI